MINNFYGNTTSYFIGVVEDINDPLEAGRVRVRIFGLHSEDADVLPSSDLPWSQITLPATEAGISGIGRTATGILNGAQVFGIFLDGETKQNPLVLGVISGISDPTNVQINRDGGRGLPGNNPERAWDYFITNGATEEQAAALISVIATKGKSDTLDVDTLITNLVTDSRLYLEWVARRQLDPRVLESVLSYYLEGEVTANSRNILYNASTIEDAVYALTAATDARIIGKAREIHAAFGNGVGDGGDFTASATAGVVSFGDVITSEEHLLNVFMRSTRTINKLVVHWTATYVNQNITVHDVDDWHRNGNGWANGIGYHFLILRDGSLQVGRNLDINGSHTLGGHNANSVGIAFVGGFLNHSGSGSTDFGVGSLTAAQFQTFNSFLRQYGLAYPDSVYFGHSDLSAGKVDPDFDVRSYVAAQQSIRIVPAAEPTVAAQTSPVPTGAPVTDSGGVVVPDASKSLDTSLLIKSIGSVPKLVDAGEVDVGDLIITPPVDDATSSLDLSGLVTNTALTAALAGVGGEPVSLDDLTDTSLLSPALAEYLKYDGANWINATIDYADIVNTPTLVTSLNDLSDLTITTPVSGQVMRYDGAGWVNAVLDYADLTGVPGAGDFVDLTSNQLTIAGNKNFTGTVSVGSSNVVTVSDYTATDVLAKLITVDGAGSLLDSDFLDGQSGGFYLALSNSTGSTTDITEGTNLYYTTTRANTDIDARVTKIFVDALNVDADTLDGNDSSAFVQIAGTQTITGAKSFTAAAQFANAVDGIIIDGATGAFGVLNASYIRRDSSSGDLIIAASSNTATRELVLTSLATRSDLVIDSSGNTTANGDLIVTGDLTISGTTTFIDTNTLNISDNIFTLNVDEVGAPTQDAGMEIERGTSPNVSLLWDEAADKWQLTNDGTNYFNIITSDDFGAGSGIDADLFDGLNSTQFLRSDADDTTTGVLTVHNAAGFNVKRDDIATATNTLNIAQTADVEDDSTRFKHSVVTGGFLFRPNSTTDTVIFHGNGDVNMTDNLMIGGTGTPDATLHVFGTGLTGGIFVEDSSGANAAPVVRVRGERSDPNASQSFSGALLLEKLTSGAKTLSGKHIGSIYFGGNHTDGTEGNIAYAASMVAVSDGDFNTINDMPTALVFRTGIVGQAYGVANSDYGTEAMRIGSSGLVTIASDAQAEFFITKSGSNNVESRLGPWQNNVTNAVYSGLMAPNGNYIIMHGQTDTNTYISTSVAGKSVNIRPGTNDTTGASLVVSPSFVKVIDANATATAGFLVEGGGAGGPMAIFRRTVGTVSDITIHGLAGQPNISFGITAGEKLWSIGTDGTDFKIVKATSISGSSEYLNLDATMLTWKSTTVLGSVAGNTTEITIIDGSVGNRAKLVVLNDRVSAGADWTTSKLKLQKRVDVSDHSYISLGTDFHNNGFGFGNGTGAEHTYSTSVGIWTYTGKINANGEIDINGNKVWHAGNDGVGSGLDAGLLDGLALVSTAATISTVVGRNSTGDIHCRLIRSDFATQTTTIAATAAICFRNSSSGSGDNFMRTCSRTAFAGYLAGEAITWTANQIFNDNVRVILGTGSDMQIYHDGTTNRIELNAGNLTIKDGATLRFTFARTTGDFTATGNVTANSDERLKNILNILDRPALIDNLTAYEYTWKDSGRKGVGPTAQEVQKHGSEFVIANDDGILSLDYGKYAVAALYEEKKKREALEGEVQALKKLVQSILDSI